ncbi:1,4-alpha-glucan branching enzyme [uncultured delta proteobacterium]|uniref:1,4-alpha-glucan branching enzyme n=1 Tax=uncultured delta proteobacterium TaxID=34034 RepID=A0A212JL00_9DELT|nr:1,4-alpha-glucan branching enzyme [uncultured delta proteobacterium]
MPEVTFTYHTGTVRELFNTVRLTGNWSAEGRQSGEWRILPMDAFRDNHGCLAYRATVSFANEEAGKEFFWGVIVNAPGRVDLWGIAAEYGPFASSELHRAFTLDAKGGAQSYCLAGGRYLGANKYYRKEGEAPGIRFSVWAPHAQKVETVIESGNGDGYIWNNGKGAGESFAMTRDASGIWATSPDDPALTDYTRLEHARYMFRITREDGSVAFRTDLYSRCQAGKGTVNPEEGGWNGKLDDLESTKSCSVVKNPDSVNQGGGADEADAWVDAETFWAHEFSPLAPVPSQLEDLIIYEMHIAGLWTGPQEGQAGPGTLRHAMGMLDYLTDLGVNAVELLPMSEFEDTAGWGYGSTHFHAIKYDREGQDLFKRFVRECHRRGIAVIVDVVYNHYSPDSERVHWMYDTTRHDHNMYYYYKGKQEDYPEDFPEGGYCDNYSTGYLPNVGEEMVRAMLIGSAAAMLLDYHVDGFRMDLTQALHSFNVLHKDGSPVPEANESGIRFMREWARTLRLFKPGVFLLAEDHSGWNMLAREQMLGGVGFTASWWSEWYHQLIGDADQDSAKAHLLRNAGYGTASPLRMNVMAGMLLGSPGHVVYHESHDESGNSERSARNIEVAVNGMLFDNTRAWGEARCRVVAGMTLFSAGTPMFFMGEEVCAREPYRHGDFLEHREDFKALRESSGGPMFRFYQDIIRLRRENPALHSANIAVLKAHNQSRVLVWHRWLGAQEFVIVASLSNTPYDGGYVFSHRNLKGKTWVEVLNSEAPIYGGPGGGNNEHVDSNEGTMNVAIPACGIIVLARKN